MTTQLDDAAFVEAAKQLVATAVITDLRQRLADETSAHEEYKLLMQQAVRERDESRQRLADAEARVRELEDVLVPLLEESSHPCACAFNHPSYMRSRWEHNENCPIRASVDVIKTALARRTT